MDEIDGFPVPPNCPAICIPPGFKGDDYLYVFQACGYRAWMDEVDRLDEIAYSIKSSFEETDQALKAKYWARVNAGRCRTWKGGARDGLEPVA